jgi:hypothetical protein
MSSLKKHKSDDGCYLYEIEFDGKKYYLADKQNYKNNIQNLIDNLDGMLFDSIVIIFGIDSGSYIDELRNRICELNRVIIIEPNKEIYNAHKFKILDENINLIAYDKEIVTSTLRGLINYRNFNRLHVHCFGNYERVYEKEYKEFIQILDNTYYTSSSSIGVVYRFRKLFFENLISNMSIINNSSPLSSYINLNKNTPAIVVSAGPSLDKNIQTMLKYKENLNKFFIIAGNRTMGSLIKNGITPNLVISIDPAKITYDMMKNYLDEKIPLAFYEYSNKDLVKEYKGDKVYISELFSRTISDLKNLSRTYIGGSVAHTCIDVARIMGCNPIILVGQDCALTDKKHHSYNAIFDVDKNPNPLELTLDKDIYGNEITTTMTLKFFKSKIEEYITNIKKNEDIEFINASYGAKILGAPHKELDEIINSVEFKEDINNLEPDKNINIDFKEITDSIFSYINEFIDKSEECICICNKFLSENISGSLIDMDKDDENFKKFIYVLQVVDEFEYNTGSYYLGGYFTKFLFEIRQKYFEMPAEDYSKLTSDFKYQSTTFLHYFEELKTVLEEVKDLCLIISHNEY